MRRGVAAAAAALLGIWLVARFPPRRIENRVTVLRRNLGYEPARRRYLGSSAAADRAFFLFLETARRALPPGARGVALYAPGKQDPEIYLAAYQFAPLPMRVAPEAVPPGWVAAFYGGLPPGWSVVRVLPGGVLAEPPPR